VGLGWVLVKLLIGQFLKWPTVVCGEPIMACQKPVSFYLNGPIFRKQLFGEK